jgi:hypothetical protein
MYRAPAKIHFLMGQSAMASIQLLKAQVLCGQDMNFPPALRRIAGILLTGSSLNKSRWIYWSFHSNMTI